MSARNKQVYYGEYLQLDKILDGLHRARSEYHASRELRRLDLRSEVRELRLTVGRQPEENIGEEHRQQLRQRFRV